MGTLLALFFAATAWGASFDCARAAQPVERAICGDAALSALDERMGTLYRQAMGAFWAPMIRTQQRDWLAERDRAVGNLDRLRALYRQRIAALEQAVAVWGHASHRALTAEQIAKTCIALPADPEAPAGAPCQVAESSALPLLLDGRGVIAARYTYPDPAQPDAIMMASVGVALFAAGPDGRYAPVFADRRGVTACGLPRLIQGPPGVLLHLQCRQYGTGDFNAESIFAWREGQWRPLDIESWTRELRRRLPQGLEVWKGIFPDYTALTARTPLWRPSDGNCCPTGGRAEITLAWQGDRLVLRDLRVTRGQGAAQQ